MAKKISQRGIQVAALTDLNTAMNCPAFYTECSKYNIACLFGMEAWTSDHLRTLVLFSKLKLALDFCNSWYNTLPDVSATSRQFYVDENGKIIGELKRKLEACSSVSFERLKAQVEKFEGVLCYVKVDEELWLEIGKEGLFTDDGIINLSSVEKAFERLQVPQAEHLP